MTYVRAPVDIDFAYEKGKRKQVSSSLTKKKPEKFLKVDIFLRCCLIFHAISSTAPIFTNFLILSSHFLLWELFIIILALQDENWSKFLRLDMEKSLLDIFIMNRE